MSSQEIKTIKISVGHNCRGPRIARWSVPVQVEEDRFVNADVLRKVDPTQWESQLSKVVASLGIMCQICGEADIVKSPVVELWIHASINDRVGKMEIIGSHDQDKIFA